MDTPRSHNLHLYIKECKRHNVSDVVRVCEPTYSGQDLKTAGIELHDLAYDDGTSPPIEIIKIWLELVKDRFANSLKSGAVPIAKPVKRQNSPNGSSNSNTPCIAVHCVAGLGRAPVLVALAMIEFGNVDPIVAVDYIRRSRRGAINEKQLNYLEQYVRVNREGCSCVIL